VGSRDVSAGKGYNFHVTGLTHDDKGYPAMTAAAQEPLVKRLMGKVISNVEDIQRFDEIEIDDAEVIVVAYGITSRVATRAVRLARAEGLKVGMIRLIVCWPFPEKTIRDLAVQAQAFVVPELNCGQMFYEVERCAAGNAKTTLVGHAGGAVHRPETILEAIREALR